MKKRLIALIILISASTLLAQAPQVSNVRFEQRNDGSLIVDIWYDLSDSDGETKKIEIEASDDAGATWTLPCDSLTGDVGLGVALGTEKHVIWDFKADNPNESGSSYKVRVIASEVGTMTGNDGKVYQIVKIGNQWWMAENSKETKYRDGSVIPMLYDDVFDWEERTTGARCYYENGASYSTYGYLYNWYAVGGSRNMAPSGWRVPTNADWTTLENYLGGADVAGGKVKEAGTAHWKSPNEGATNESGFSALPGGYRSKSGGTSIYRKSTGYYWSATEYNSANAWFRTMVYHEIDIHRNDYDKHYGFSVRLVKE